MLGMVAHPYSHPTQEVEASGSLQVWGQFGLYIEFQISQSFMVIYSQSIPLNSLQNKIINRLESGKCCGENNLEKEGNGCWPQWTDHWLF